MIRTPRIRCHYCGRRIPASSVSCPNCHRNPRLFYWKRGHTILVVAILALGACVWLSVGNVGQRFSGWMAANSPPTRTATRKPLTVVVIVTPRPPSPTRTAGTGVSPTRLYTPTHTPTPSPAPTDIPSPTSTRTRAPVTRRATDTPIPTPTPQPISAPILLKPADNQQFIGRNQQIIFEFVSEHVLAAGEFFRLQVDYIDRNGANASWCAFTRSGGIRFPKQEFDNVSPFARKLIWRVGIVKANATSTSGCEEPFEQLSAQSEVWTFYWY